MFNRRSFLTRLLSSAAGAFVVGSALFSRAGAEERDSDGVEMGKKYGGPTPRPNPGGGAKKYGGPPKPKYGGSPKPPAKHGPTKT
jgi:hypothetical protein